MRKLIVAVLVAALLWSGYWLVGAGMVRRGIADWFETRRAEGWAADYAKLSVWGFPNRFDATLEDVALGDPATGLAWSAPFFQLFALSYRPHHVIAVWPEAQSVATPLQRIAVATDQMRASAVFRPGDAFTLDHGNVVIDGLGLSSTAGWSAEVQQVLLALRTEGVGEARYRLGLEVQALSPAPELLRLLDPAGALPPRIDAARLDATARFDQPWDRRAIEEARPQLQLLDLHELSIDWGGARLRAAGTLEIDAEGVPEGRIEVSARDWRAMLRMAVASGALPEVFAPTAERALAALAAFSGREDTVEVPLVFEGGRILLGPIPLGPAPRLVLR